MARIETVPTGEDVRVMFHVHFHVSSGVCVTVSVTGTCIVTVTATAIEIVTVILIQWIQKEKTPKGQSRIIQQIIFTFLRKRQVIVNVVSIAD